MKISWIKKEDSQKLLIFFAGFAADENLLKNYSFEGFDVLMFYGYESLELPQLPDFSEYFDIYVLAWSFGVWVADYVADRLPKALMRVALCGSTNPVDDELGIPGAIFEGTLKNFDEASQNKFAARVFGGDKAEEIALRGSNRSAADKKRELETLAGAFKTFKSGPDSWSRVIAARNDKIFPQKNLEKNWGPRLEIISGGHFPHSIFENGISRLFVPTDRISTSFARSFASYEKEAGVQKKIAEHLAKLIFKNIKAEKTENILEIGVGTGFLTRILAKKLRGKKWHLNDLNADSANYIGNILDSIPAFIAGDAQIQDLPAGMDLIVSASCFQWMKDLEGFLAKISALASEGAVLAFSTFLPENLREIRSLAGKGLSYVGIVGLESMLHKTGFEILCSEAETIKLEFESPMAVLRHLRETGVGGSFAEFWTPKKLKDFSKRYFEFFPCGKGVSLTYRPIYFIAQKSDSK